MNNQKGYIITAVTFFVLIIMVSMGLSMGFLVFNSQKRATNAVKSTQSYYASEAGIEDALLRLKRTPAMAATDFNFLVGSANVDVDIPATIGIAKNIISQADNGVVKKLQVTCTMSNVYGTSFYYGIAVGPGGLTMGNGSRVMGNVFSAGNVSGSGTIDNNLVISGNGHSVSGVTVHGNAFAYSCLPGATIDGKLTYVEGGQHTCSYGSLEMQSEEISEQPMPIPQSQIDEWKNSVSLTPCNSADVTKLTQNSKSVSMGPCKITGDINFGNGLNLTLTGVLYITGNLQFGNSNTVNLSPSQGSGSGVLIAGGTITTGNTNIFNGSGQPGSYILIISTSTSDSAIFIGNSVGGTGGVFYTNVGALNIGNTVSLVEATGYKVIIGNSSIIQYSSGIVNIYFASGTGGSWVVTGWQEQ